MNVVKIFVLRFLELVRIFYRSLSPSFNFTSFYFLLLKIMLQRFIFKKRYFKFSYIIFGVLFNGFNNEWT